MPLQLAQFLGSPFFTSYPYFQSAQISSSSQILSKRGYSIFTNASKSAFRASAWMSSGPAPFPFFTRVMAFLISSLVGLLQLIGMSEISGSYLVDLVELVYSRVL